MRIIKFIPAYIKETVFLPPKKSAIPEWWRQGETTIEVEGTTLPGMKTCVPFMEIMSIGYCLVTPFDIYVTKDEEGKLHIQWNGTDAFQRFVDERPPSLGSTLPRPAGHHPNGFVWSSVWGWKTPKGYGSIVTHPFNRHDLPFTTLSGFIDSDGFHANGNIPFFIKEDFTGMIPAGTPFAQIVPVKRGKWAMYADDSTIGHIREQGSIVRVDETSYKKKFWKKFMSDFK